MKRRLVVLKARLVVLLCVLLLSGATGVREARAQALPPAFDTALEMLYKTFVQGAMGGMSYSAAKNMLKQAFERFANFPEEAKKLLSDRLNELKTSSGKLLGEGLKNLPKKEIEALQEDVKRAFMGSKRGGREQSIGICVEALRACLQKDAACRDGLQKVAKLAKLPELPERPKAPAQPVVDAKLKTPKEALAAYDREAARYKQQLREYEVARKDVLATQERICAQMSAELKRALGEQMPRQADLAQAGKDAGGQAQAAGMQVFQALSSAPERMKETLKELLWMPLDDPLGTDNDPKILKFFQEQIGALSSIREAGVGSFKPLETLLPKADFDKMLGLTGEMVAGLATPIVRIFQFVRTKIKDAIRALIWVAIRTFDTAAKQKDAIKEKLEEFLHIKISDIPPWVFDVAQQLVKTIATAVGAFGGYLLNSNPEMKARIMSVVDGIANAAESLDESMRAAVEVGSAVGGDDAWIDGEGADVVEQAAALAACASPSKPDEAFKNRCAWALGLDSDKTKTLTKELPFGKKVSVTVPDRDAWVVQEAAKPLLARLQAALDGARKLDRARWEKKEGRSQLGALKVSLSEIRQLQASGLKRERMSEATGKMFLALRDAFVSFMTPILQQAATLLGMAITPALQALAGAAKTVIALIPYVGGAAAAVWGFVADLAIPILVQIPPAIIIPVALDVVGEEIKDLKGQFMDLWDDPSKRKTIESAQAALKGLYGPFKVVIDGIVSLRTGLSEGISAVVKGPLLNMLLAKVPYGLGGVIQTAVEGALAEMFPANGQFNFDIMAIAGKVLDKVKDPLIDSVFEASADLSGRVIPEPGLTRLRNFLNAVKPAAKAGVQPLIDKLKAEKSFAALLDMKVIRSALGRAVFASAAPMTDFILGESLRAGASIPCVNEAGQTGFRDGLIRIVQKGIVPLIEGDDTQSVVAVFQKGGLKALIPRVVQMAMEKQKDERNVERDAPLVALLSCVVEKGLPAQLRRAWDTKWKERFAQTLYAGAALISSEESIDKLIAGGLPALIGAALQVAAPAVAGLAADVLKDPVLEGELAAAIVSLSGDLSSGAFTEKFTKLGFVGTIADYACNKDKPAIKRALFGVIARKLGDPDVDTALEESCELLSKELKGPNSLSLASFQKLLYPAARFAFRKAVQWGTLGAAIAKEKLKTYLLGALKGMGSVAPAFGEALTAFTKYVVPALDKGGDAFFAKLSVDALPCAEKIQEAQPKWAEETMTCVVRAGGAAVAAGGEAAVRESVQQLAQSARDAAANPGAAVATFKSALSTVAAAVKGVLPAAAALEGVVLKLGDVVLTELVLEAGTSFATALAPAGGAGARAGCANKPGPSAQPPVGLPAFLQSVGSCVVEEVVRLGLRTLARVSDRVGEAKLASTVLTAGVAAAMDLLKGSVPEASGAGISSLVGGVATLVGTIGDAAVKTGAAEFSKKLRAGCIDKPGPSATPAVEWLPFAKDVGTCVVAAAQAGFKAGALGAAKGAYIGALGFLDKQFAVGVTKLKEFAGSFLAGIPEGRRLLTVLDAATDAGKAAFLKDATPCQAAITLDVQTSLPALARCVLAAAQTAFKAGGLAGAQAAIRELVGLVAGNSSAVAAKLDALVGQLQLAEPTLRQALTSLSGDAVRTGVAKFKELAEPCAGRYTQASAQAAKAVATCLVLAARAGALLTFARALSAGDAAIRQQYQANVALLKGIVSVELDHLMVAGQVAALQGFAQRARVCRVGSTAAEVQALVDCIDGAARAASSLR